jgi:hypothetical protein
MRLLALLLLVVVLDGCRRPSGSSAAPEHAVVCPARASTPARADSAAARVRIYEGPAFRAGDRVVIVVDDTVRGIAWVQAGAGLQLPGHSALESLAPNDVADLRILKYGEANATARPCEVEGGRMIRTVRTKS